MEIIENREEWVEHFQKSWLATYKETGETDWKLYQYVKNSSAPGGAAIDLSKSRLAFISSAGAYLKNEQKPFQADDPIGDYEIRLFPSNTDFASLDYAHTHYDQEAVRKDPQVLLPLLHLKTFQEQGVIGELTESVVSFMGYQPDAARVIDETLPEVLSVLRREKADAALLVPA